MEVCRRMWSKNFVLLANIPPQVGHATSFSCVWLRMCSRNLNLPLKEASQSRNKKEKLTIYKNLQIFKCYYE